MSDGVLGAGKNGVHGVTNSADSQPSGLADSGVFGESTAKNGGNGVSGTSVGGHGVYGQSAADGTSNPAANAQYSGVCGFHTSKGPGVLGSGNGGSGVVATSVRNYGLFAEGGQRAAFFRGNVLIDGDISSVNIINVAKGGDIILAGGDCAEHFDTVDAVRLEPGTVVVIDREGTLRESREPYDKKVAGVVSGAGGYRAAIVLDSDHKYLRIRDLCQELASGFKAR